MDRVNAAAAAAGLDVRPMSVLTGAEIVGVDFSRPLAAAVVAGIHAALQRWKVIFLRGVHLDHAGHVAFARQLGSPTIGHILYGHEAGFPEIYSVARRRERHEHAEPDPVRPWSGWHTDLTTLVNPPMASILRGVAIPAYGGDTQFANLAAAYSALSPAMQAFLAPLRALHGYGEVTRAALTGSARTALQSEHPLVRVHPDTGEHILFVSPSFLQRIVSLTARESQVLLEFLWEHCVRPEFVVRFRWQPGDIAIWDNRATMHLAPEDIFATEFERQLYRITLAGDIPIGPDGQPSRALVGEPLDPLPVAPIG